MSDRVCIFVDGENFRHSIVNLFESFRKEDYLPSKADWQGFFEWLATEASAGSNRIRTYWYVVGAIDFHPYKLPKADRQPDRLKAALSKHDEFLKLLDGLEGPQLVRKMQPIADDLNRLMRHMRQRFDGWHTIQDGIATRHLSTEFRRAGSIQYNLFERSLKNEKGVDVKLATDLIVLRDIYDVAVIVSGDQDYVPAVEVVKDSGKQVVNVSFMTRGGKLLPGGAWRLNKSTDWNFAVPYGKLGQFLNIP